MAKKEEVAESNALATIEGEKGEQINVADLLKQLGEAEIGAELTSEYFTLEPGESERVIFLEMSEMNKMGAENGEMTDAVRLLGSDGNLKICADKVIVSTCRSLANKGKKNVPIEISCTGKEKGAKGTYKTFSIKSLLM